MTTKPLFRKIIFTSFFGMAFSFLLAMPPVSSSLTDLIPQLRQALFAEATPNTAQAQQLVGAIRATQNPAYIDSLEVLLTEVLAKIPETKGGYITHQVNPYVGIRYELGRAILDLVMVEKGLEAPAQQVAYLLQTIVAKVADTGVANDELGMLRERATPYTPTLLEELDGATYHRYPHWIISSLIHSKHPDLATSIAQRLNQYHGTPTYRSMLFILVQKGDQEAFELLQEAYRQCQGEEEQAEWKEALVFFSQHARTKAQRTFIQSLL